MDFGFLIARQVGLAKVLFIHQRCDCLGTSLLRHSFQVELDNVLACRIASKLCQFTVNATHENQSPLPINYQ